jgi:hypothetical protein
MLGAIREPPGTLWVTVQRSKAHHREEQDKDLLLQAGAKKGSAARTIL